MYKKKFEYQPKTYYVGERDTVDRRAVSFAGWLRKVYGLDWLKVPRWKRAEYYGEYRVDCVKFGYSYENPKLYFLQGYW